MQKGRGARGVKRTGSAVVLWGDHGWKLGEHNSWCKMTNYEIDTRAPLIVHAPGRGKRGSSTTRLVEFVDVYPTLCDLTGLAVPEGLEGTRMVPLIEATDRPWKSAAFSQYLRAGTWAAPDGVEYVGYAVRTDRFRYVEWYKWKTHEQAAVELHDEQADPEENENIAVRPEHGELLKQLSAILGAPGRFLDRGMLLCRTQPAGLECQLRQFHCIQEQK